MVGDEAPPALRYDNDRRGVGFFSSLSDSFFSAVGVVTADLPKSKAVPGVFGVLFAEPKAAKAPEPSPKAGDFPAVGEATELAVNGALELKGLFLDVPVMLPNRLGPDELPSLLSCRSDLSMERDSLPAVLS